MNNGKFEPNILSIGGGTGLSTMLRGLKKYTSNITAVVAVADDGGGSGILRDEFNMLPPGDIRNCILALSETEPIMEKLLRYRFQGGSLSGQSFGNLFLAAMNEIFDGDFVTAIKKVSDVLKVTGRVFPVTNSDVELVARLEDGTEVVGESEIGKSTATYKSKIESVRLRRKDGGKITLLEDIREKIRTADVITIGPGSLYTSVLSALMAGDLVEELSRAAAPIVYICNVMTQPGETDGYTAYDHIGAILKHTSPDFIDYCIINSKKIETPIMARYAERYSEQVVFDEERFKDSGIKLIKRSTVGLIDDKYIRHNADVLADAIIDIVNRERRSNLSDDDGVLLYVPHKRKK